MRLLITTVCVTLALLVAAAPTGEAPVRLGATAVPTVALAVPGAPVVATCANGHSTAPVGAVAGAAKSVVPGPVPDVADLPSLVMPALALGSVLESGAAVDEAEPVYADDQPESVYAPPAPPRPELGENQGGVHLDLKVLYVTDYVYRGLLHGALGQAEVGSRGQLNAQFDGKLSFDFGKLPHPFVGCFVNLDNSDEVSRFEEVRPRFGFDWEIKPLLLTVGNNSYIFPERENTFNTAEVYTRLELNDSLLWKSENPILSPYIYAAYDYELYHGWYFETGMRHDFVVEETGLTISPVADVAYVLSDKEFQNRPNETATGFQHFDVGVITNYSLNHLLNISNRYGQFVLQGFVYYTNGIDSRLRGDSLIWGGGGIDFKY